MNEDKFVTMKKIYRLSCYKTKKESKPEWNLPLKIKDVCPYKFAEIQEACKHCRWFTITDLTRDIKQQVIDQGVSQKDKTIVLKMEELEEIPYDPKGQQGLEVQ